MHSILRRTPDIATETYTESHMGRGADYDESFEEFRIRANLWEMEQEVLHDLVPRTRAASVLDVACGTGRITEVVARELPAARLLGIDAAESMLAQARGRVPGAQFECVDLRQLHETVPAGSIDLATAFRFFPNADPALRTAGVDAISAAVRPGGFVLLNNHRNFWSPSYILRRARRGAVAPGALNRDMLDPFKARGFSVMARRSLAVLPHSETETYAVPERWAERFERVNLRRLSARHSAGTDTIWLLQKRA